MITLWVEWEEEVTILERSVKIIQSSICRFRICWVPFCIFSTVLAAQPRLGSEWAWVFHCCVVLLVWNWGQWGRVVCRNTVNCEAGVLSHFSTSLLSISLPFWRRENTKFKGGKCSLKGRTSSLEECEEGEGRGNEM